MYQFRHNDKLYRVNEEELYDTMGQIELPDGVIVEPAMWLESMPPQIREVMVIDRDTTVPVFKAEEIHATS